MSETPARTHARQNRQSHPIINDNNNSNFINHQTPGEYQMAPETNNHQSNTGAIAIPPLTQPVEYNADMLVNQILVQKAQAHQDFIYGEQQRYAAAQAASKYQIQSLYQNHIHKIAEDAENARRHNIKVIPAAVKEELTPLFEPTPSPHRYAENKHNHRFEPNRENHEQPSNNLKHDGERSELDRQNHKKNHNIDRYHDELQENAPKYQAPKEIRAEVHKSSLFGPTTTETYRKAVSNDGSVTIEEHEEKKSLLGTNLNATYKTKYAQPYTDPSNGKHIADEYSSQHSLKRDSYQHSPHSPSHEEERIHKMGDNTHDDL